MNWLRLHTRASMIERAYVWADPFDPKLRHVNDGCGNLMYHASNTVSDIVRSVKALSTINWFKERR